MIVSFRQARRRVAPAVAAILVLSGLVPPSAGAEVVKCQRAIAKAGAAFVQAKAKALNTCEQAVVKGTITGPCPDGKASDAITKANEKLVATINKDCGGDQQLCGGVDRTNEDTPSKLGWPRVCPNFEHGTCTNAINDCGDIATCISCIGEAVVDQAMGLYYDALALPSTSDPTLNKCQASIGKAAVAFFNAKTKALQKCWDARLKGKHSDSCVPPAIGDGKYIDAIAKAEAKKQKSICKACGGSDKTCDGVDDIAPGTIGFPGTCPFTAPGGPACGGGMITSLQSLVDCVDCITAFKADCTDRLQLPGLTDYPSECSVCPLPPPSGPCPTSLTFTADGPGVDLDTGFTGLAHDASVPTNGQLTLAISGCAGTDLPTCGQCTVNGPLENAGGPAFDNHRCSDKSWITCNTDGDCVTAGATGPCIFYFGTPLPLVAGGVSTCVMNRVVGSVGGTINLDDGSSTTGLSLRSEVHTFGDALNPCPLCQGGTCQAGARVSMPCTVQGTGVHGDVSLDCPPNNPVGTLTVNLDLATGTQSRTVSAANPICSGAPGKRCLCDTCNNANAEACSTNGDCPLSGGNPGICGGRRCIGGPNIGAPCTVSSQCPGGTCDSKVGGTATVPNSCLDDSLTTMVDGDICPGSGPGAGICPEGPVNQRCSVETFRSCQFDYECNPPPFPLSNCPACLNGQFCEAGPRPCFPGSGVVGDTVTVTGSEDPPCGDTALPSVGSFFCVAPTSAPSVNSAGGLPGLGRISVPGKVVVSP